MQAMPDAVSVEAQARPDVALAEVQTRPEECGTAVQASLANATKLPNTTEYSNPFAGPCKGDTKDPELDDVNASQLTVLAIDTPFAKIPGSICAPRCGCPKWIEGEDECEVPIVTCPTTNLPAGTTATPKCMLGSQPRPGQNGIFPSACALVCDPSDPSKTGGPTSKCPKGATCEPLYEKVAGAEGIFDTGVCTYARAQN